MRPIHRNNNRSTAKDQTFFPSFHLARLTRRRTAISCHCSRQIEKSWMKKAYVRIPYEYLFVSAFMRTECEFEGGAGAQLMSLGRAWGRSEKLYRLRNATQLQITWFLVIYGPAFSPFGKTHKFDFKPCVCVCMRVALFVALDFSIQLSIFC